MTDGSDGDKKRGRAFLLGGGDGTDAASTADASDSGEAGAGGDNLTEETGRAVEAGARIIAYGPNTARRLRDKLAKRGFSRDAAETAVEAMVATGLVDDRREIDGAVYCAARKGYGPRRVEAELARLGFERSLISGVDYDALGIDFAESCRALLERRGGVLDPKTRAYLASRGFTDAIMREAAKKLD